MAADESVAADEGLAEYKSLIGDPAIAVMREIAHCLDADLARSAMRDHLAASQER